MQLFFISSLSYYNLIYVFCILPHYKTILHQKLPFRMKHFSPGERLTCFGGTGGTKMWEQGCKSRKTCIRLQGKQWEWYWLRFNVRRSHNGEECLPRETKKKDTRPLKKLVADKIHWNFWTRAEGSLGKSLPGPAELPNKLLSYFPTVSE